MMSCGYWLLQIGQSALCDPWPPTAHSGTMLRRDKEGRPQRAGDPAGERPAAFAGAHAPLTGVCSQADTQIDLPPQTTGTRSCQPAAMKKARILTVGGAQNTRCTGRSLTLARKWKATRWPQGRFVPPRGLRRMALRVIGKAPAASCEGNPGPRLVLYRLLPATAHTDRSSPRWRRGDDVCGAVAQDHPQVPGGAACRAGPWRRCSQTGCSASAS